MPRTGRPKKPTELHKRQGTYREDRHAADPAGDVSPSVPRCPSWVRDDAKKHWRTIGKMLADYGVMGESFTLALAMLVNALARLIELEKHVERNGHTVSGSRGSPVPSPEAMALTKAHEQVMKMLREFGVTPASMSAVASVRAENLGKNKSDKQCKFFGSGGPALRDDNKPGA